MLLSPIHPHIVYIGASVYTQPLVQWFSPNCRATKNGTIGPNWCDPNATFKLEEIKVKAHIVGVYIGQFVYVIAVFRSYCHR